MSLISIKLSSDRCHYHILHTGIFCLIQRGDNLIIKLFLAFLIILFVVFVYGLFKHREFTKWLSAGDKKIVSLNVFPVKVDTEHLPLLLKNYISRVIKNEVSGIFVELSQKGVFKMSPSDTEMVFEAHQKISLSSPSFSWVAKIIKSGVPIIICDRLIDNQGELQARLFGSLSVAKASGSELLRGELLRYLAEVPWYPLAILNQPEVRWKTIDATTVSGEIEINNTIARIEYYFDENGLIERIFSPDRGRMIGSEVIPTPWEGSFSKYKEIKGLLIPTHGEVSWFLPGGKFTYFKGDIVKYKIK